MFETNKLKEEIKLKEGYDKIFLGMIVCFFNVNIGNLNLLPNFIGYIFIVIGIGKLEGKYEGNDCNMFEKGKNVGLLLTLTSLLGIFIEVMYRDKLLMFNFVAMINHILITLLYVYIFGISAVLARNVLKDEEKYKHIVKKQKTYIKLMTIFGVILSFSLNISTFRIIYLLMFFVSIWSMVMVHSIKKSYYVKTPGV